MTEAVEITGRDIAFVVQGAIEPENTASCLASIRTYFPDAELILSTYEDTELTGLDYDKAVLSPDPGFFRYSNKPQAKANNINRQLVTTLAGLRAASRPYTFKIRTDFALNGSSFVDFFALFPSCEPAYQIFERKLLACSYFSRNPRQQGRGFAHHPSDIAFFGLTTDLLKLFDIPLMTEVEASYYERKGFMHNRYVPEQYLWINCLRQNDKTVNCDHLYDCNTDIQEATERYFASNFIFLDWRQFCLSPPAKFISYVKNDYDTCITHVEWLKLYQYYLNSNQSVPKYDDDRKLIRRKKHQTNICRFIAKILVLPIIGKSRQQLRQKIKQSIVDTIVTKVLP